MGSRPSFGFRTFRTQRSPHDYLGEEIVSQFYKGDITFLLVHLAEGGISLESEKAIADIKALLDDNQRLIGQVVSGIEMKELGG